MIFMYFSFVFPSGMLRGLFGNSSVPPLVILSKHFTVSCGVYDCPILSLLNYRLLTSTKQKGKSRRSQYKFRKYLLQEKYFRNNASLFTY